MKADTVPSSSAAPIFWTEQSGYIEFTRSFEIDIGNRSVPLLFPDGKSFIDTCMTNHGSPSTSFVSCSWIVTSDSSETAALSADPAQVETHMLVTGPTADGDTQIWETTFKYSSDRASQATAG